MTVVVIVLKEEQVIIENLISYNLIAKISV